MFLNIKEKLSRLPILIATCGVHEENKSKASTKRKRKAATHHPTCNNDKDKDITEFHSFILSPPLPSLIVENVLLN